MSNKPNILMLLADDMGEWAMGCAGNDEVQTPNIDALAEDGMRFDNFFCASPVCSPARASIFTGAIPSRHGVHDYISHGNTPNQKCNGKCIPAQQYISHLTSYTELLQQNGYTCALSGKWHLGDSLTPQKGFEKWYTIGQGGCWYFNPDIVEKGKIKVHKGEYITDLITANAIKNIKEFSENKEQPFYLSVHYTAPHSPWGREQQKGYIWKKYRNTKFNSVKHEKHLHPLLTKSAPIGRTSFLHKYHLRGYYSAITAMDEGIGQIIQTLKQAGLYDNTIIMFTADNGMNLGQHGLYGKGNATYPPNMFDTSVKIPFILHYPECVKKGTVNKELYSHYDIMPTLIDLLDLEGEVKQNLCGKSFAGLLKGEAITENGCIVILSEYGASKMIRSKDYKLIIRDERFYNEFYDLRNDPNEEHNLYKSKQYSNIISELRTELEEFLDHYSDEFYRCENMTITGQGQINSFSVDKENAFNEGMCYVFPKKAAKFTEFQKNKQDEGDMK